MGRLSPLAISIKLLCSSAGYVGFRCNGCLMKLFCSGGHFADSWGPESGRERGKNQKGIAESSVMTPAMR